ncbi:hypothetical protein ACHAW6_000197 [Cyclotella cf. meneghiniana]
MSSSKQTKHIKSKYFFVTDKVEQGDIVIEHVPKDEMWCNMSTEPMEGICFKTDRSKHMNCPIDVPDEMALKPKTPGVLKKSPASLLFQSRSAMTCMSQLWTTGVCWG